MPLLYTKIILFFISLFCAALFAFLETAFTALRLFKIKELSLKVGRYKGLFEAWEKNPSRILITILIACNLADVLCSVLITDIVQAFLGDTGLSLVIGVVSATALILFFGEIMPKSYAKLRYESLFGSMLWMVNGMYFLFYPIVTVLLRCTNALVHKFEGESVGKHDVISEKELKFLIAHSDKAGMLETEKSEMLQNVFSLGNTLLKEVLVPAVDIVEIEVNESLEMAMALFSKYRYTRLPVYEKKEDNIIGMIHQKDVFDLLYRKQKKALRDILMPILLEPETKRINQLLSEFLKKRIHMAIVIDEYGDKAGLVTLEDIIEEIVGDILDEHESEQRDIVALEEGGWMVDARIELEKLGDALKITFEVEDSVTLGGFLAERLQHVPKKGERVLHQGYCFQIQRATSRRVFQVLVFKDEGEKKKMIC